MPANAGYSLDVPGDWACCLYFKPMEISRDQLDELTGVVEDTVEYYCDQQQVSGELVWSVLECLAIAKQAELKGELAAA